MKIKGILVEDENTGEVKILEIPNQDDGFAMIVPHDDPRLTILAEDLDLGTSALNVLKAAGIKTTRDLLVRSNEICRGRIPNGGRKMQMRIDECLAKHGLVLGQIIV